MAEQFPSAEAFEQHLLSKHVKPFKIKISRIASKSMVNAFDKENTLVVSKEDDLDMEFLRHKYNLRDLYVCLINYRSLRTDYVYKVVFNDSQNSSINGNDTVSNENDDSRCNKYVDIDLVQLFAPSVTMRVGSQPLRRHENDGDHIVEEGISQTIERAGTSTGRIWSNILHFQRRRKPNRTTVSDAKHDLLNTFLKSGHFLSSSSLPVVPMPLPLSKSASVLSSTSSLISDLPCCDSASQHSITRISTLAAPASIAAATLSTFTSSNTKLSHRLHMSPVPIIVSELPFNKKNAQQRTCDNSIVTPAQYTITRTTMPYRPAAPSIPPSRAGSMFREHSFRPRSVVVWPPTACLTSNLSSLTNFRSCILPKNVQKTTVTCSTSTSVLTATKSTVLSASVASINTNHSKIGSNGVISLLSDTDSNASDDDVQLIDAENDNGVLSNNNNNNECVPLV